MLCKQPKANVNDVDSEDRTALMYACEAGHFDSAEVLINFNSNLHATDKYGESALHYALRGNKENIFLVRILCQNGVMINQKNRQGHSALHIAALKNSSKIVPILVQYAAEIDATDSDGKTPLMLAAENGGFDSVKLLVENKASLNICDTANQSASDLAEINGHGGIAEFLAVKTGSRPKITKMELSDFDSSSSSGGEEFKLDERKMSSLVCNNSAPKPRAAPPPKKVSRGGSNVDTGSWTDTDSEGESVEIGGSPKKQNQPSSLAPNKFDLQKLLGNFNDSSDEDDDSSLKPEEKVLKDPPAQISSKRPSGIIQISDSDFSDSEPAFNPPPSSAPINPIFKNPPDIQDESEVSKWDSDSEMPSLQTPKDPVSKSNEKFQNEEKIEKIPETQEDTSIWDSDSELKTSPIKTANDENSVWSDSEYSQGKHNEDKKNHQETSDEESIELPPPTTEAEKMLEFYS